MNNADKMRIFPGALTELGTFELTQPIMRISDPGYNRDVWCSGTVENCKAGTWEAAVFVRDEDQFGDRMGVLAARHAETGPKFSLINRKSNSGKGGWSECPFEVGVDSGQAGIFDDAHYQDNDIFDTPAKSGYGDEWYNHCCDITFSRLPAGVLPYGVVSSSGFGDGGYYAMQHTDADGEIDGIYVVFDE